MFAASAVIGRQAAKTLGQRAFRSTPRAFGGADEPVRQRARTPIDDRRLRFGFFFFVSLSRARGGVLT